MAGTKEGKSGVIFGNSKDENIIYFASTFNNQKTNSAAEEIKRIIEQYNLNSNKGTTIVKEEKKKNQNYYSSFDFCITIIKYNKGGFYIVNF